MITLNYSASNQPVYRVAPCNAHTKHHPGIHHRRGHKGLPASRSPSYCFTVASRQPTDPAEPLDQQDHTHGVWDNLLLLCSRVIFFFSGFIMDTLRHMCDTQAAWLPAMWFWAHRLCIYEGLLWSALKGQNRSMNKIKQRKKMCQPVCI